MYREFNIAINQIMVGLLRRLRFMNLLLYHDKSMKKKK